MKRGIEVKCEELFDSAGPSGRVEGIDGIVVTEETKKGAEKINGMREEKGLRRMEVVSIPLLGGGKGLSSTLLRKRDAERGG